MNKNIPCTIVKNKLRTKLKRKIFLSLFLFVFTFLLWFILVPSFSYAKESKWWKYGSDPINILWEVKDKANGDTSNYYIQDTALDWVNDRQWTYERKYKIANTLTYVKDNMHKYLQWLMYIWLALATILLILQGLLMVTNATHKQWEFSNVKKNITKIFLGVFFMTGFLAVIKLVLSLVTLLIGE